MSTHDLETLAEMARAFATEAVENSDGPELDAVGTDDEAIEELTDNAWHYYGVHCFEAIDVSLGEHGGALALVFQAEMARLLEQRNGGS